MNYLLGVIALISLMQSLRLKRWLPCLVSLCLLIAPALLILDTRGLFYHAMALLFAGVLGLLADVFTRGKGYFDTQAKTLGLVTALPYLLVCLFKALRLQGIAMLKWSLLITLLAFIYLTLVRRRWDATWWQLLFVAASSAIIMTF